VQTIHEQKTVTKEIQTAARHSAIYGLGGVLARGIGFLMLPFYTHYLKPVDYGVLEILDLSMSLLGMFLNMGITAALLRSYTAAKSHKDRTAAVSSACIFVAATGAITFCLMAGTVRPISGLLFGPGVPSKYLLLSVCSFVLAYIANAPRTYLRAMEASGAFVIVETAGLFAQLALNVYFIAVLRLGLMGVLLSSLLVGVAQTSLLCGWTIRKVGLRFSRSAVGTMVRFGLPLIFSNLTLFALNFSDRLFLQHLRSLDEVGIYSVGYKFGYMLNFLLVQPFYVMWQARMYVIHSQPEHPRIFPQIFVLYSLVLTCAGLGLALFSREIVAVMVDPKFASCREVIPVVAAAYVFGGLGYFAQVGMFLTNNTRMVGAVSAVAACLNIGLNYVLILQYGMMGAAWATLLSFVALAAGSHLCSQRVFPMELGVGRVALAMSVAAGLYLLSRCWTPASLWISVLMKVGLLAAFPVLVWSARILSRGELDTLLATWDSALAQISKVTGLVSRKTA
jgi:O-antigen/teichoic acid export membrane protein